MIYMVAGHGKNEQNIDITAIHSLDIETNQYYNYRSWRNTSDVSDNQIVMRTCNVALCKAIDAHRQELEECDYIGGRNIYLAVHDTYIAMCRAILKNRHDILKQIEICEIYFDALTSENGANPVTASHAEMYMACVTSLNYIQTVNRGGSDTLVNIWDMTLDEYTDAVKKSNKTFFYSTHEVNEWIKGLYNQHNVKKDKGAKRCVVVIHNLSYEVNNCLKNCDVIKHLVATDNVKYLSNNATDTYKSMEIMGCYHTYKNHRKIENKYPAIYVRDTWKLTGKSIKALGKDHGYKKLDYDYECIRHKCDLTQIDHDYNARDTEIALLGLYDAMMQYGCCEDAKLYTFPVSQNNIISSISKNLYAADYKKHKAQCSRTKDKDGKMKYGGRWMNAETYAAYKTTTGGGLVTVNPQFAFNVYEKDKTYNYKSNTLTVTSIDHIDLNSAHPSQVYKRLFPVTAPRKVTDRNQTSWIKDRVIYDAKFLRTKCTADAIANDMDRFDTVFESMHTAKGDAISGFATFTFKKFRSRDYYACGIKYNIPVLWQSKMVTAMSGSDCVQQGDTVINLSSQQALENGLKTVQGKIVEAEEIEVTLTFEDFAIVNLFCDFDSVEMHDIWIYKMGLCSEYLYKQINYFGHKKSTYKAINKAIEKRKSIDIVSDIAADPVVSDCDRMSILHAYNNDAQEGENVSARLLKVVKGQFNGIYGSSYQSLYRDCRKLYYDEEHDDIEWVENIPEGAENMTVGHAVYDIDNKSGVDVLQGSYIAQWSRVDIACNTLLAINCNAVPLYIATDSIYMLCTQETRSDVRDIFNGKTAMAAAEGNACKAFNKQTKWLREYRTNKTDLGGMDYETAISKIAYTQALKVVYVLDGLPDHEDPVRITFSGVPADVFFDQCKRNGKYNDQSVFERLLQENGYAAQTISSKTRKIHNQWDDGVASQQYGYVLDHTSYYNNYTGNPLYTTNRAAAYNFI